MTRQVMGDVSMQYTMRRPMNPYYDPAKPHHRRDGFQNLHGDFTPRSLADVLRWKWRAWRAGVPPAPREAVPAVLADLQWLHANATGGERAEPAATFIGHATVLVQIPLGPRTLTLLTDPMFSERASPLSFTGPRRHQPPGVRMQDLPHVDLVLISHNHYDHLDEASVRQLAKQPGGPPRFVVPLGLAGWLASHGVPDAIELDWWDRHVVEFSGADPVEVTLTPARHWSARGIGDRMRTLWGGFVVLAPRFHLFYSGDTGYAPDFADIRSHFAGRQGAAQGGGFDLALLPIGAYEPRWFMRAQHVDPAEAVQIHRDVGAQRSVGVHWGTFALTDEAVDAPPRALAAARDAAGLPENEFSVMAIGETRRFPCRPATCANAIGQAGLPPIATARAPDPADASFTPAAPPE